MNVATNSSEQVQNVVASDSKWKIAGKAAAYAAVAIGVLGAGFLIGRALLSGDIAASDIPTPSGS